MIIETGDQSTFSPPATTFYAYVVSYTKQLTADLHQALRETMFDNRFEVRPALFGRIATDEIGAVLAFLAEGAVDRVEQRGRELCRSGFGEEGMLRIGQALRRFCVTVLPDELRIPALEQFERYHSSIMRGFIGERKAMILEEQERIRSAIQRTNHRFAVQMEVAADIARAATSILDLGELLQTAVELIRQRFDLYYVGIFLADDSKRWATLQANAGEPGQVLLRRGHRLKIGGDSLVGWCVANGEARIALDVAGTALSFDRPLVDDIHSEMVVPLISRNKVVGAMAVQSRRVGAFAAHDVPVYRIIADQLANAIENARLFFERERRIAELATLNQVGQAVAAALELDSLLERVHEQLRQIFAGSQLFIAHYDSERALWHSAYHVVDGERQPPLQRPLGNDLISMVIRDRQSLRHGDDHRSSALDEAQLSRLLDAGARVWMATPMAVADSVVGAMVVYGSRDEQYTEQDLALFSTIAAQVAIGIANARLYERVRQQLIERERAAEELRLAKEAAEGASRAKSAFLATMSHELRTPLTAILGYAELIQRAVEQQQYDHVSADLTQVMVAGRHLLSLINEVLDFSKIEADKMHTASEPFMIAQLLEAVASTVRPLIEQNGNRFRITCPPDMGLMVSDAMRIRQVLVNLLGNAAKFTDHGLVELAVRREQSETGAWVVFEVSDTGIGIATEKMQKLFQPFSQINDRPERLYGGTGLGLALSQRLCQLLGGTIDIASTLALGSTFTVRLPDLDEQPEATELARVVEPPPVAEWNSATPAATLPVGIGDALVLIIDDDQAVCDLFERHLRGAGFATVAAADADEGLRLAQDLLPEAVLLDIRLPDRDGWEVLTALKSDPALAAIPVIMLTIVEDQALGYQLGAADYLVKPISADQLLATVRRALSHTVARSRGRILMGEDDLPTAAVLRRELEGAGWQVDHVTDGAAVLHALTANPPDLLLLELLLPEKDGVEVIEALQLQNHPRVPTIVLTAQTLSDEERARLTSSVDLVLQKGQHTLDLLLEQLPLMIGSRASGAA